MKKGKSRNKRKKTRSRLLWIAIAVIGIAAVISAVCVAGMLATKENAWKTPEELLVEYMDHIPKQEYEEMYAMLHIEASGNVSQEDFVTRNSAIYEGIEVQNIAVQIIAYDEEQMTVTYQTSFDTVAGTISFENKALFLKNEEGYQLVWDDSLIFPNLASTDKVRVSTTQAERGEILDRNGRVLAGKGTASSVGIVPGKLENREEAIAQIAGLLEITTEVIEKNLSAKWVKDDSFVPIKTIPRVEEIELMSISPDEEVLKEKERHAPYVADDNLSVSAVYQIPKEEFESVIMKYFNIDSETLQSKTVYYSEDSTYEYKPRGFEEVEYPEYPYSEVVGFTENNDGTITLTANVVFPYAGDSKVYAHEVVVRPLENGRVQYVSNRIIPSEDNYRETWHTPRLTLEEWEELYGGE